MKKVFVLALALISLGNIAVAQKGSILLYGNLDISTGKDSDGSKSDSYGVNPGVGYQFSDHFTAGLNIGVGGDKSEIGTSGNYDKTSYFNIGPFIRYSKPLGDIFSVFMQADFNYLSQKESDFDKPSVTTDGFGLKIAPNIGVNVIEGFCLNFGFGGIEYKSTKADFEGAKSSNQFDLSFGQQINVGISKNFGGKKK